ncbi:hypothetical protein [Ohtaekwangia koreensis]|uniref:hypothetical protein n=1 Tax=Ohtaekwangia koreensis TaxID=688867 RepID=UPI001C880F23|nr:hypothetical protein [Ohtaekwangia koreensis]
MPFVLLHQVPIQLLSKENANLYIAVDTPIIRLHTQKYGTLDYDPSVPCIIATHFGYATNDEFRSLLNLGLSYAIEKKKKSRKAWAGLPIHY